MTATIRTRIPALSVLLSVALLHSALDARDADTAAELVGSTHATIVVPSDSSSARHGLQPEPRSARTRNRRTPASPQ